MNSHEINPGVFKVLSVEWGNRGPNSEKAIILSLQAEDGEILSVANNWVRDQQERYNFAKKLIGEDIRYSTWQKNTYAKDWFKELEIANQVKVDSSQSEGGYFDFDNEFEDIEPI